MLLSRDKEFERNKKEIIKRMKATNPNLSLVNNKIDYKNKTYEDNGNRKYAWEYEIEEYRKKKNLERFYKIGALSGILSLIITIAEKFIPISHFTSYIFK